MDQLLEVINVKTESTDSTSSDQVEISSEVQANSVKQESDFLIQTEIYIKTQPLEFDDEFPVIADISYEMCPNDNMGIETEESFIKIEHEDAVDELMQDPLDVGDEIKAEVSASNLNCETSKKSVQSQEVVEEYHFTSDNEDSNKSDISGKQDQLFVGDKKVCKDKKHICHVCYKTFGLKGNLNTHLLIHSRSKPFRCEICIKSFARKGHLDGHMLIHTGEKPHICDVCQKAFGQKATLYTHKLIHSGMKPFLCDVCNKSFKVKQELVVHKRIHTGEKPFSCTVCNKAFINASHLIVHKRIHTGEKPYSCDVCSKSFSDKSACNRHKRIHKN